MSYGRRYGDSVSGYATAVLVVNILAVIAWRYWHWHLNIFWAVALGNACAMTPIVLGRAIRSID